jgi:hypothetical protein
MTLRMIDWITVSRSAMLSTEIVENSLMGNVSALKKRGSEVCCC